MKRTLIVVALVVGFAAAAGASSLSVVSSQVTYTVGQTIVLTVTGSDNGPGQATYSSAIGRLLFNNANTTPFASLSGGPSGHADSQTQIGTGWITSPPHSNSTPPEFAFDQINQVSGGTANIADNGAPFATVTMIAQAAGVVNVTWSSSLFTWFGMPLAQATGTTFTVIPEPATAALLSLGLVGLVLRRKATRVGQPRLTIQQYGPHHDSCGVGTV